MSDIVFSEGVVFALFKRLSFIVSVVLFMFVCNFTLGKLNFGRVKGSITDSIAKKSNSTTDVALEALKL